MDPKATDAARSGATLLDEKRPGWFNEIDLPILNMARCDMCVIGQVFNLPEDFANADDFWNAVESLLYDHPRDEGDDSIYQAGERLGFEVLGIGQTEQYDELTEAWKHEIGVRREGSF